MYDSVANGRNFCYCNDWVMSLLSHIFSRLSAVMWNIYYFG